MGFRDRRQSATADPADATAAEQLTRELERTRQFSAMVAHEMRNLMAPLVYGAELLGRTDDPATARKVRHDILISVAGLRRLIEDLLNTTGCASGQMSLVTTLVDLSDVVNTSVELVRPMFPTRNLNLDVVIATPDRVTVAGDFCRLTQVVSNLVINAAKFTPDNGDIIVALASDAQRATIKVKDSGIGMASEELPRIFDAFSRVREHSPGGAGLGLGLSIARQLVEMHGGELTASSAGIGMGSEFVVRLPLVRPS